MVRGRPASRGRARGAGSATSRSQATPDETQAAPQAPSVSSSTANATPSGFNEAPPSRDASTPANLRGGAATGRRVNAPSTGRFRPKNIRRDEAERDSIARLEEQKASARVAEEKKARGRGRFRSKRSRGDAMGARGGRTITAASGPFSGGWANGGSNSFGGSISRVGGGGGGGGGGGSFGGSASRSSGAASSSRGAGFSQAEAGPREARINADKLHSTHTPDEEIDSEDEAMINMLSSRSADVLPMGIYRKVHRDAGIVVATTAELEAAENATGEEESLWIEGAAPETETPQLVTPDDAGSADAAPEGRSVSVKEEPGVDDAMDLDAAVEKATEKKQNTKKIDPAATKKKPILQVDPEDKLIQSDLDLLAGELGSVTVTSEDGKVQEDGPSNKDGRLYLFQFPPLLPPLRATAETSSLSQTVKAEPKDVDLLGDMTQASVDLTRSAADDGGTAKDADTKATDAQANGKGEADQEEEEEEFTGFTTSLPPHGGLIGQLQVHKSGKVSMDWGGRNLEMSPAAGMNFLTTAVILEESDEKLESLGAGSANGGDSIGMGKIMGRFVLAPTWSEEEDWTVDPADLEVPESSQDT